MCDLQEAGLSAEQQAWLQQMVTTYGSGFDRAKWVMAMIHRDNYSEDNTIININDDYNNVNNDARWVATMLAQNKAATAQPVPAPRPPSPQVSSASWSMVTMVNTLQFGLLMIDYRCFFFCFFIYCDIAHYYYDWKDDV